ncbi:MAG: hypothetical protein BRC51_12680, partial [Cyanobacteria bacterium SW_12_48_29]
MGKLVVLKLGEGDFEQGFPVTLQIGQEGRNPSTEIKGRLPPAPDLPKRYEEWQAVYLYQEGRSRRRLEASKGFVSNVSFQEAKEKCDRAASNLRHNLNEWLKAESFRPLRERWFKRLQANEELRVILQTQDRQLQRLPWHLCDLFEDYDRAEIALSNLNYEEIEPSFSSGSKVRILAILGDSRGIDTEQDRNSLQQLPNAEVTFLEEPQRQQLSDHLWEQSWDILFFAGHSASPADASGRIYFNSSESLTVAELKDGLHQAIKQGLQLAIFNSCDGLGLAQDLAELSLPQVIVMREPVPDQVAQEFLKYFLSTFADGKSLYLAVREARGRLEGMEKKFPCATWLPVIYQNPAEVPPTWQELSGAPSNPQEDYTYLKRVEPPSTHQEYRDRQTLLDKVGNYWVKGVLETSLHEQARIELGLEERRDAVAHPWGMVWETPNQARQTLGPGVRVINQFDQMGVGRTLLILGEPGSGKTITLLELARDLIERAERDAHQPIPVVFNLSSWTQKKQTIAEWLVQELHAKYEVSDEMGRNWITEQKLLLLLDGLDEVSSDCREDCVRALNEFSRKHGQTEMVVCSRVQDYEALTNSLKLQNAIYLQPLTPEQGEDYLINAGFDPEAVRSVLSDGELQELARTPLMLNIIALAYQGKDLEALLSTNSENRRRDLFDAYMERMFNRRGGVQQGKSDSQADLYPKEQVMHWLSWLAQRMSQESQSIFLIERMQPSWLLTRARKCLYGLGVVLITALIFELTETVGDLPSILLGSPPMGAQRELATALVLNPIKGLFWGVVILLFSQLNNQAEIQPVETLKWSWERARSGWVSTWKYGLIFGVVFVLISVVLVALFDPEAGIRRMPITGLNMNIAIIQLYVGLMMGAMCGPIYGLVVHLAGRLMGWLIGWRDLEDEGNRSLRQKLRYGLVGAVLTGLLGGLVLVVETIFVANGKLVVGLLVGSTFGLLVGLAFRLIVGLGSKVPRNGK